MMKLRNGAVLTLILGGLFSLVTPLMALALETGGVGITPANPVPEKPLSKSWFLYEVDPGTVIEDAAIVQNNSDIEQTITVEGLDAFLTEDGAFALTDDESTNEDIGTWIKLSEKQVTLAPRTMKTVPFTITVPKDAEVGDHIGGLAVSKNTNVPDRTLQSGGVQVGVSTRVGARIYMTVKGDMFYKLSILQKKLLRVNNQLVTRFKFHNDGNIRVNLQGQSTIYSLFGVYDRQTLEIGTVIPKKTLARDVVWPGKQGFMMGPYLARIKLVDSLKREGVEPMKPVTVWLPAFFIPAAPTAIILILLFLAWLIFKITKWLKLSRLAKQPVAEHTVQTGETLYGLAAQYGVDWKLVATLNSIKPPYHVEAGTTLYIPDARGSVRNDVGIPSLMSFLLPAKKKSRTKPQAAIEVSPKPTVTATLSTLVADKGDTLQDIADFAGITVAELAKLNQIKKITGYKVKAGQEFLIPDSDLSNEQ